MGTGPDEVARLRAELARCKERLDALRREIARVIVGYDDVVEQVVAGLLAGGHALLEGAPGLGKTLLVRTLASALDLTFSRVQFTPDLMPADITGTQIVVEGPDGRKAFEFRRGPVFAHVLLADEVNRATPKTQSALLEAMAEGAVTAGNARHALPSPFLVLATQNPIEMEGTYPLPEAQLDRFLFRIDVPFPPAHAVEEILGRTTGRAAPQTQRVLRGEEVTALQGAAREVVVPQAVLAYVTRLVCAAHPTSPDAPASVRRYVRYGPSVRGAQALVLAAKAKALLSGVPHAGADLIRWAAVPALRHRLVLNFEAQAEGVASDRIVRDLLEVVPEHDAGTERLLRKV